MPIPDALTQLIDAVTHQRVVQPSVLHEVLSDPMLRRRLLNQHQIATALAQSATAQSGIDCAEVEDQIAILIDSEQRGENLEHFVPVQQHIHACPWCSELYGAARGLDSAQISGSVPQWPQQLKLAASLIPPSIVPLVVPRREVRRAIQEVEQLRAIPEVEQKHQPIMYTGLVPGHPDLFITIQLTGKPSTDSGPLALLVQLQGTSPIGNRTITLQLDSKIRSARTNSAGQTSITDVPDSWLEADAGDLLIFIGPA